MSTIPSSSSIPIAVAICYSRTDKISWRSVTFGISCSSCNSNGKKWDSYAVPHLWNQLTGCYKSTFRLTLRPTTNDSQSEPQFQWIPWLLHRVYCGWSHKLSAENQVTCIQVPNPSTPYIKVRCCVRVVQQDSKASKLQTCVCVSPHFIARRCWDGHFTQWRSIGKHTRISAPFTPISAPFTARIKQSDETRNLLQTQPRSHNLPVALLTAKRRYHLQMAAQFPVHHVLFLLRLYCEPFNVNRYWNPHYLNETQLHSCTAASWSISVDKFK